MFKPEISIGYLHAEREGYFLPARDRRLRSHKLRLTSWEYYEPMRDSSMSKYDVVLQDASELSVPDRIQLIEALWNTVPENEFPPILDEWLAEIAKRSAEFDSGNVAPIPWSEIKAAAFQRWIRRT